MRLKMWMLRYLQQRSFKKADGLIFLTNYAHEYISRHIGDIEGSIATIPHGVEERFLQAPRSQKRFEDFSAEKPFRFLYVSILMPYKRQVEVAWAASELRNQGLPIVVDFVGGSGGSYAQKFKNLLTRLDPFGQYLIWHGAVPFNTLHNFYKRANGFVFASSCESMPNILVESMASGLPIAASNRGPMPEILGEAGIYFDPERPTSIAEVMREMFHNEKLREALADAAWKKGTSYTWRQCADETLNFVVNAVRRVN